MADLLPPNASDQERALSNAVDRAVPVVVREVWSPDTCPAALLPWLAWAFSVDTWDPGMTEAQKRAVIKASVAVHQRKGTIGALQSSLDALGYDDIDVTEWFQMEPQGDPYTFALLVGVEQTGIEDQSGYDRIIATTMAAKNLRSHLVGVDVLATSSGSFYIGGVSNDAETTEIDCEPVTIVLNEMVLMG